jgi:hypothetical protein
MPMYSARFYLPVAAGFLLPAIATMNSANR